LPPPVLAPDQVRKGIFCEHVSFRRDESDRSFASELAFESFATSFEREFNEFFFTPPFRRSVTILGDPIEYRLIESSRHRQHRGENQTGFRRTLKGTRVPRSNSSAHVETVPSSLTSNRFPWNTRSRFSASLRNGNRKVGFPQTRL
jgi:hypothetical protein